MSVQPPQRPPASAAGALLGGILDYAGLFPPARLELPAALEHYRICQRHRHSWMLARFVLPLEMLNRCQLPGRVTLVCRGEGIELPELPPEVESLEVAGRLARPADRFVFHELDWKRGLEGPLPEGGGWKLRTGGLTPDAIPPGAAVARFLLLAAEADRPVKFTAGLHQPLPHFDPGVGARVFGFLNVFSAALAAFSGQGVAGDLEQLLALDRQEEFDFTPESFRAGKLSFHRDVIARLRAGRIISFGSCSFLEPVEYLESHGYLPSE
jgi:hypothetical protein